MYSQFMMHGQEKKTLSYSIFRLFICHPTARLFCHCPEKRSCHRLCRWIQVVCTMKLPFLARREKKVPVLFNAVQPTVSVLE